MRASTLVAAMAIIAVSCGAPDDGSAGAEVSSTSMAGTSLGTSSTGGSTPSTAAPSTASSDNPDVEDPVDTTGTTAAPGESGSPLGAAEGGPFVCTEVLGYSQAGSERNGGWFTVGGFEELPGIDDGAWQLRWRSSAESLFWTDPDFDGWRDGRLFSQCDTPTVDRVVLFFLHRSRGPDDYPPVMAEVAASLGERYPDLRQVVIEPMVGGPGEELCTAPVRGGTVFSTEAHRWIDEAVAVAADGFVVAGASPEVQSCEQFVDKPGHLSPEGAVAVAEWMAAFYGS